MEFTRVFVRSLFNVSDFDVRSMLRKKRNVFLAHSLSRSREAATLASYALDVSHTTNTYTHTET